MKTKIKQFIRKKNSRKKIGVMVAKNVGDSVKISWSLCSKLDYFDPEFGESMAESRIDVDRCPNIPSSIVDQLENFKKRATTYFKGVKVYFVNREINGHKKDVYSNIRGIMEQEYNKMTIKTTKY